MGSKNHFQGIDNYAVALIQFKARQLTEHPAFNESDREDIEQELVMDLLARMPKYNPDIAQQNTFIARIIERRVATIIKRKKVPMRDYRLDAFSLNEDVAKEEGGSIQRIDTISQEEYLERFGNLSHSPEDLIDLTIDIKQALDGLSPVLRILCERLKTESVAEIAKATGIPRGTLYEYIHKIKERFEDAELGKYL